ncbi:uncharacterized protein LOC131158176 [Malania oleifera]|uniref:uncharacterized protein LOC131158176 n=1 Tax=Malania oleifera TaxID=397392 RepID=UPI0025AE5527|nr:uncharacterized protein LOC131158176 [Malania oleifera]
MGKRKRTPDRSLPSSSGAPSDVPCSSGKKLLPKEIDIMDNPVNLEEMQRSPADHHYNLSRSIFLKRSRHYFGHQYSRRNSINHASVSTSHGKSTPLRDDKFLFKLSGRCKSESGHRDDTRKKAFYRPERIRSSSLITEAMPDVVTMVCEICQKLLKRKAFSLGNLPPSLDVSVVAVLVCGHVYHADCLDQRTCHEDRRDPPCPLCMGLVSKVDISCGEEPLYIC